MIETVRGCDKLLLGATLALTIAGFIMVFSASAPIAQERHGGQVYYLVQQVIGAAVGWALVLALLLVRRPLFRSGWFVYGLLAASALLLALCFVMPSAAHTNRWVTLAGVRFQPSELAKISLVVFFAYWCETRRDRLADWRALRVPIAVLLGFLFLIVKEPNLSTAMLVGAISVVSLYIGGVRLRVFAALGLALALLFGASLLTQGYQLERVRTFLSGDKDPLKEGFQVNQSKLAVGSGGLLGVNAGGSRQKLYYLPYAHTDFIYAIVAEEVGLAGAATVLLLFGIFLWRGLTVAFRAQDPVHRAVAAGLTLAVVAQALLNIAIVLGIGPVSGVPLPFLSYGRSSLVCSLLAAGLILNVSRRRAAAGGRP